MRRTGRTVGGIDGGLRPLDRRPIRGSARTAAASALEIRSQGCGRTVHARLPSALAELQTGWETFLQFAQEVGAIGLAEKAELEQRSVKALGRLAAMQAKYQVGNDPALRFVGLLQAALSCGRAHVAGPHGKPPPEAEQWGWQQKQRGSESERQEEAIQRTAG